VRPILAKECEPPFFHSVSRAALRPKNGGWSFALIFLHTFFIKEKSILKKLLDTFAKASLVAKLKNQKKEGYRFIAIGMTFLLTFFVKEKSKEKKP
jgi:hypothetical protein